MYLQYLGFSGRGKQQHFKILKNKMYEIINDMQSRRLPKEIVTIKQLNIS